MTLLSKLALVALLLVVVYDPSDSITHAKVYLFVATCLICIVAALFDQEHISIPYGLLFSVVAFSLLIPLLSLLIYLLFRQGSIGLYDGAKYFKAFLFALLAIPLMMVRVDIVKLLAWMLCPLAGVSLITAILVFNNPGLWFQFYRAQDNYGLFWVSSRSYGPLSYLTIYFHTAPLLVVAIAHFTRLAMQKRRYLALVLLTCLGIAVNGTRNCILASLALPLAVVWWYGDRKQRAVVTVFAGIGSLAILAYAASVVLAMVSAYDMSNIIRARHFADYMNLFQDPKILFFGQGIGSYFNSSERGFVSESELTYLEIVRQFGLILALPLLGLIFYPLLILRDRSRRAQHHVFIAYAAYLGICITDPLLLSSTGMLMYAIVLYEFYVAPNAVPATAFGAPAFDGGAKRLTRDSRPYLGAARPV